MIKIENLNSDIVQGFLTTFNKLPKKAMLTKYITDINNYQNYAVYISYSKNSKKVFLIKVI